MFYTYIWRDANGTPFYVGKGKGKRYLAAHDNQRSKAFMQIYASGACVSEIVDEFIHESEAFAHEMELIQLYGRREFGGSLVNLTDGGEGPANPSRDVRAKISAANKGRKCPPHVREAVRLASLGNKRALGLVHSDETRRKLSIAALGRIKSIETCEKLRKVNNGRIFSFEWKNNISLAKSGKKLSDEHRAKISVAGIGRKKTQITILRTIETYRLKGPSKGIYKCVSLVKKSGKYRAQIIENKKQRHLGCFHTPEQAARAYDKAAIAAWGIGNCYLNFPNEAANYVDIAA